jgi:hypothetical protein
MTNQEEILPCPFCGSKDISHGEVLTEYPSGLITKQSMCCKCKSLGAEAVMNPDEVDYGDVKAIAAWNKRASAELLLANTPVDVEPYAWSSFNTLTQKERIERLPVQSLQTGVYKHTPLYTRAQLSNQSLSADKADWTCNDIDASNCNSDTLEQFCRDNIRLAPFFAMLANRLSADKVDAERLDYLLTSGAQVVFGHGGYYLYWNTSNRSQDGIYATQREAIDQAINNKG